jgi:hypothetical protein
MAGTYAEKAAEARRILGAVEWAGVEESLRAVQRIVYGMEIPIEGIVASMTFADWKRILDCSTEKAMELESHFREYPRLTGSGVEIIMDSP